ncbi:MAG: 3-oxoacyl-[acyl-carrier-protein] synthase III C-terminal domain-containing protein [Candidatus Krumholzibacteriia bacterium]
MAEHVQPSIRAVGTALPPHHASQEEIVAALRDAWGRAHYNLERLEDLHRAVQVNGRYLALPLEAYADLTSFGRANDAFIAAALDVGEQALAGALAQSGLAPDELDHLLFVSTTGIATPSLDARLVNRLGLRRDIRRTPVFGLGCAAGAGGVARAADYLRAYPGRTAAVVSVELCSLTLQREDLSIPNIIASGLFGDGAAAVILAGADRHESGPRVVDSVSVHYPDTERVMGWDVVESGLKIVLSARVPEVVRAHVGDDVDRFLAGHGLERDDIAHWVAHTGGPRVLEAFREALGLDDQALERSWRSLREMGNVSSTSVLFVLAEFLSDGATRPGDLGVMAAMGPGFASELVLLRW